MVPVCGYFGARNSDSNLMCLFCGCNAVGGCCGMLGVLVGFLALTLISGAAPAMETYAKHCDPRICVKDLMEQKHNHHPLNMGQAISQWTERGGLTMNQTIDCLAASWKEYKPVFDSKDVPHLSKSCMPVYLECGDPEDWDEHHRGKHHQGKLKLKLKLNDEDAEREGRDFFDRFRHRDHHHHRDEGVMELPAAPPSPAPRPPLWDIL